MLIRVVRGGLAHRRRVFTFAVVALLFASIFVGLARVAVIGLFRVLRLGGGLVIDMPSPGAARSFWLQEALADDPGEPAPPLESHLVADVCIVGGGFAGLWTAIQLTDASPACGSR